MFHPIVFFGTAILLGFLVPYFFVFYFALAALIFVWAVGLYFWVTTADKELGAIIGMIAMNWTIVFTVSFGLTSLIIYALNSGIDYSGLLR